MSKFWAFSAFFGFPLRFRVRLLTESVNSSAESPSEAAISNFALALDLDFLNHLLGAWPGSAVVSSRREADRPGDKDRDLAELSEEGTSDSALGLMGSWPGSLIVVDDAKVVWSTN